eukprot:50877-Pleurochrysis_carterae.AAC.1
MLIKYATIQDVQNTSDIFETKQGKYTSAAEHLRPHKRLYMGTGGNERRAQRITGSDTVLGVLT